MIRVFLLSLLCLAILVMVARSLPAPAAGEGLFAPWDGVWEGTFRTYAADGGLQEVIAVRQEYTTRSPTEQEVVIVDRLPDGTERRSRGRNVIEPDGTIACSVQEAGGAMKRLIGTRHGKAIVWHRSDAATGLTESFREEILQAAGGDLYTIDGAGIYGGSAPRLLLFEGRYRRVRAAAP